MRRKKEKKKIISAKPRESKVIFDACDLRCKQMPLLIVTEHTPYRERRMVVA